ncbi:hypothetical protein SLA2020_076100 [Shorea laevis]
MVAIMRELGKAMCFVCSVEFWRMAVLWTFSLLTSYWQLYTTRHSSKSYCFPRCKPQVTQTMRPVCVITGATSGLGAAAAQALSREGFYVVLVGRSSCLLSKIVTEIKTQNEDAYLKGFQVDLTTFQSILDFKSLLQQWLLNSEMHLSIQLLINNAGILATSSRLTPEGYDEMLGTNYVGPFCLTKLLLPLLKNSPIPSRIVNVTSFTHRSLHDVQVDKDYVTGRCFLRAKQYPYAHVYEYSKLCLLLFSYELHRQVGLMDKYQNISVIAADPGVVETNIMREVPYCLSYVAFSVLRLLGLLQFPTNGVSSIIDAALAPPETSGVYFFGGKGRTIDSSVVSNNSELAKKLWTISCDLCLQSQLSSYRT